MKAKTSLAVTTTPDGTRIFLLRIEPHPVFILVSTCKTIEITEAEFHAIERWKSTGCNIQEALPHWSPDKRELLLTGMDATEFKDYLGDD